MPGPVNRRASLPGASELFGSTRTDTPAAPSETRDGQTVAPLSGRVKHDQKITVYFSTDELFALEDATLEVRRRLGRSLDRGRLVRAAVAVALADLEANGSDATVVKVLDEA